MNSNPESLLKEQYTSMGFEVYGVRVEDGRLDLFLFLIFLNFISILFSYFGLRIRGWYDITCDSLVMVTYHIKDYRRF